MTRFAIVLLLVSASAFAASRTPVAIVLKQQALVDHVDVRLGDVAEVRTRDRALRVRFEDVAVGWVPRNGARRTISRTEVETLLARSGGTAAVSVEGARATTVRLRAGYYPAARLFDVARERLLRQLHARYPMLTGVDVTPVGEPVDLRVPAGRIVVDARPIRGDALAKRVCVWVDLRLNDRPYRRIPVWLRVAAYAPAVVTKRTIKPREKLQPGDVAIEERDVTGTDPALIAKLGDIAGRRARTFIPAGAVVQTKNLEPNPPVLTDELVKVRVVAGSVRIETQAIAEQDGYIGDYIKVRNPKTAASFSARVIGENAVAVTER